MWRKYISHINYYTFIHDCKVKHVLKNLGYENGCSVLQNVVMEWYDISTTNMAPPVSFKSVYLGARNKRIISCLSLVLAEAAYLLFGELIICQVRIVFIPFKSCTYLPMCGLFVPKYEFI